MNRRGFMRQPGVAMGVSANAVAGAWRGVLGSYVPVAMEQARKSSVTIGAVITVANAASIVGSFIAPRVPEARVRSALVIGSLLAGLTTTVCGFGELPAIVFAIALAIGGLGVGVIQVLGVTVASSGVRPELRGDAVAVTGSLRALALFVSPIGIAALLPVLGLGAAVFVVLAGDAGAAANHRPRRDIQAEREIRCSATDFVYKDLAAKEPLGIP